MGFSTWNTFAGNINEDLIREAADAMVSNGMKEVGYNYINIDDGWLLKNRDENGNVIVDQSKFPSGMSTLTNYIHSLGLNAGIYSSNGQYTCQGLAGGEGFELNDAKFYSDSGFDYLKYDFCYNELVGRVAYGPNIGYIYFENISYPPSSAQLSGIANLVGSSIDNIGNNSGEATFTFQSTSTQTAEILINYATENARQLRFDVNGNQTYELNITDFTDNWDCSQGKNASVNISVVKGSNTIRFYLPISEQQSSHYSYKQMQDALQQQSNSFVFSICEWGSNQPWYWAQDDGNLWRTTGDISDSWQSMLSIYEQNIVLDSHAWVNAYNDPDMMTAGMSGVTELQSQTQMTLWCQMMAPLIVGVDIRNMSDSTKAILLNKDVIAIDQDKLNVQGKRISSEDNMDIIVKPLYDGSVSIVYFNKDNKKTKSASLTMNSISDYISIQNELTWTMSTSYNCTDLWSKDQFTIKQELSIDNIQPNEAKIYRCYPNEN